MKDHSANIRYQVSKIDSKIADLQRERARLMERLDFWDSKGEIASSVYQEPFVTCSASTSRPDVDGEEVIQW